MTVYFPERDGAAIAVALQSQSAGRLVACLCAAWCGTCNTYQAVWEQLASQHPGDCFVWIDIETHADALGDIDIENFPTVMVQPIAGGPPDFYGTLLPHAATLQKLLEKGRAMPGDGDEAPDLLAWLNPSALARSQ
ncbi:thioredoxin family protein [Cupriavidus sp. AU9028]|uniref:thioredoxin family protein n=1 Tax=Cupriavidus sp. AU9028 TaxID=2871157 RepID=UPI001C98093A|nr:thioredoxin family protein [Cupriavidus sp. AU9028]MBY4897712.1 thioredoxin family protein [Cupriavidus sp. AU9028]